MPGSGLKNTVRKRILWSLVAASVVVGLAAGGKYLADRRSAPPISLAEVQTKYGGDARRIDIAGVSVNYRDEGSGPALVLVHGSFGSLRMFDDMARALGAGFRVIRYDQPPAGLSGTVPPDFSLTSEAFLREFLDRLGVGSVALLGTSSGGIIAYRFAATYPQRVRALILSNIPPSAPVDNAGARARLPLKLRWSMGVCIRNARPFSRTCWRDFLLSYFERRQRVTDALVTEYYDLNRRTGASEYTSMTAIMRDDREVRRFLSAVQAPTLLIWGMLDPVLPPATLELLAARLDSADVQIAKLEDVNHYPPLEAPEEVAELTRRFLGD
ncbi:alpha/beta fold hydrolase [Candidatus Foliamicus sp.]